MSLTTLPCATALACDINNIDDVLVSKIPKVADDTKLYGVVANKQDKK
jgi:hypothetical protein